MADGDAGREAQHVVIEVGNTLRVGIGGEVAPTAVGPAQAAYVPGGEVLGFPSECQSGAEVVGVLPTGLASFALSTNNEYNLSKLLSVLVGRTLQEHGGERRPLVTTCLVPFYSTLKFREQVAELCFDVLDSSATYIIPTPACAAFSVGMTSAMVIDCGARTTSVCPVNSGEVRQIPIKYTRFAGNALTEIVMQGARNKLSPPPPSHSTPSAKNWWCFEEAERVKEKGCYIPVGVLPDGLPCHLPEDVATAPHRLLGEGQFEDSVPSLLHSVITRNDDDTTDYTSLLQTGLVVCGGTSLTRGFLPALDQALLDTFPSYSIQTPIAHTDPSERLCASWIGGSIVTQTVTSELYITRKEYAEEGRKVVQRKCPV
eukprot:Sspe_Gene.87210::Locus_58184_Transcript_1_1_Confidence_1.000_Length_1245::g.87210::m.87210/K16575/ACTR1, ARP1; centractin